MWTWFSRTCMRRADRRYDRHSISPSGYGPSDWRHARWPNGGLSKPSFACTERVKGPPFTGLMPAGLDVGPVIPAAERAPESRSPARLSDALCGTIRDQIEHRHAHATELKERAGEDLPEARAYVDAMLGLWVWAHGLYWQALADPHAHLTVHKHEYTDRGKREPARNASVGPQ
jgi:hypothetical protein